MFAQGSIQLPPLQLPLPLPQRVVAPNQLKFADVLRNLEAYWKSKAFEVHCRWKKLPDSFKIEKLDKRTLSDEKNFKDYTMPTLKLGNRVKIVSGMEKRLFKTLHKKVGIWKEGLTELMGKEAIVMDLSSRYVIGVLMLENGDRVNLHGFALEVVDKEVNEGIWLNMTDFKADDEVVIGVDRGVLAHLQRSIPKTPFELASQLTGFIARVMCCFRGTVAVTFNEMTFELLNPAALRMYSDQVGSKKTLAKKPGLLDIQRGTRVRVTPNLTEVMQKQRGHGEWNYKMTKFVGEEGVVADNVRGGDVIVNFSPFESYRMNRQALLVGKERKRLRTRSGNEIPIDPLKPFAVGDIVRLNMSSDDLKSNLQLLRIPLEFLVIAGSCGSFVGYVNETRVVVDFGDGAHLSFDIPLLTKVKEPMAEDFKKIWKQDKAIGVGSKVMIWVGPMQFVKKCLPNFKDGFEKALEEEATVLGFDDIGNAVIRYDDGTLYIIPDEYLCSPRAIWKAKDILPLEWDKERVEIPRKVSSLEAAILHSITEVLKANGEKSALGWKSVLSKLEDSENHIEMKISFPGMIEDYECFIEKLRSKLATEDVRADRSNGSLTILSPGCAYVMKFGQESEADITDLKEKAPDYRSKVGGNAEPALPKAAPTLERTSSVTEAVAEAVREENVATGIPQSGVCSLQIPAGVTQVVLQMGGHAAQPQPCQQPPRVVLPQESTQASGIVMNPQTTINMFGDGGNRLSIIKGYVREVKTQ